MNAYDALGHRTHPGELRAAREALKRRGYSFDWTDRGLDMFGQPSLECQLYDDDGRSVSYWCGAPTDKEAIEGAIALEHLEEIQEVRS